MKSFVLKVSSLLGVFLSLVLTLPAIHAAEAKAEVKSLSLSGGAGDGKARLILEAVLNGLSAEKERLVYATALEHAIEVRRDKLVHRIAATIEIVQGDPKELALDIAGEGQLQSVTGSALADWSVRQGTNGVRTLILRPAQGENPLTRLTAMIVVEQPLETGATHVTPLTLRPPQTALFHGYVTVHAAPDLKVEVPAPTGLVPIETKFLPTALREKTPPETAVEALAFRFQGADYGLTLEVAPADPELRQVVLHNFQLIGQLTNQTAAFTLIAQARVRNPAGGKLKLLSGTVGVTELQAHPDWLMRLEGADYILIFNRPGDYEVRLKFDAAVRERDGWNVVAFHVAPSALQPIVLRGLASETRFDFAGAARPEAKDGEFLSYLPPSGDVNLSWKEARPETEGKLFYAAEMLSQVSMSPGLLRQITRFEFRVMQGEMHEVVLVLRGPGEVTRVQGDQVLGWSVQPVLNSTDRRLRVQLNEAQKNNFVLQLQTQTPLGAFPQTADVLQVRAEGATRFTGYVRIVNDGAVRLEVTQANGLSQISPEQFPESDTTRALFAAAGTQRFAYRFSGGEYALRIQADQILPELTVSEVLAYHMGETEMAIDAEFELDIREAPLRELLLRVPKGFTLARVNASGLSDYFVRDLPESAQAELRLVLTQPVAGRQVLQLRLERNQGLGATTWSLPRVEVAKVKAVRGHVGASADAGFRLTPERTQALTEMATAFFPRKLTGLQAAFRLTEPEWEATLRVERLPQTVQADTLHLFSISEGIAYGSTLINYVVSGAPLGSFRVELPDEFLNVEFTGKDIRSWQKTTNGYLIQLHAPVSGAYPLLATFERPFRAQGETLAFTGARPLDVQSEQGHTLVTSAYQFQVRPVNVSPGLLVLEPGEVPSEYRLLFDAPILAAYRYTSRPFNLTLALSPLAQGDSLSQVVDRASLLTRISKAGQVLMDARYFVKNRGHSHFRLQLPPDMELWSATVDGAAVVPVTDAQANLVPLPQRADPNAVLTVDLKLATRSADARRVRIAAPEVSAPVLLAEWKLEPDTAQRLEYRRGSLTPVDGIMDRSGFAGLARLFLGRERAMAWTSLAAGLLLAWMALLVWGRTARQGVYRGSLRFTVGGLLGMVSFVLAIGAFLKLAQLAQSQAMPAPTGITLLAPVQQPNSRLSVEVANLSARFTVSSFISDAWPALLAFLVCAYAWLRAAAELKAVLSIVAWTLLGWTALRLPNGATIFLLLLIVFLLVKGLWPALRQLNSLPARPRPGTPPAPGAVPTVAVVLLIGWASLSSGWAAAVEEKPVAPATNSPGKRNVRPETPVADLVRQTVRVEDQYAFGNARIRWHATKGQMLPLLFDPAVLTTASFPSNAVKLVQAPVGSQRAHQLLALDNGEFEIDASYQVPVVKREGESGFILPTRHGLINQVRLTLVGLDVDIDCVQAVSSRRETSDGNTVGELVLAPIDKAWLGWKPRSRDVKREKAAFYAEVFQLFVPASGAIEGVHQIALRPAQGELSELTFTVPAGATITDVLDPAQAPAGSDTNALSKHLTSSSTISLWRFDPDSRRLRVSLNPPQSRPFTLVVRSQLPTGPLPSEPTVGLLSVEGAAAQTGLLGFGTGNDVQLESVTADAFSPINLEDFPVGVLEWLRAQVPGLTLRRAFRYSDVKATASVKAAAVEPDVRVETQNTLSLGEDRTVLAVNAAVTITRAGIFRLSFALPAGLDVESISGDALSHWTELRTGTNRVVTLHLRGKTEGEQRFALSLSGSGVKPGKGWVVPQLALREASKQRGTLVIVPEQGLRLQVAARDGVTQLDPQKSGIRQKGVLAFRVLQTPWNLSLDMEQVEPWIQLTSLQHATVNEASLKVLANLQYQIENTGLKALRLLMPTNAESVRVQGEQVADYRAISGTVTNGLQVWEIKLHRRVLGNYLLQVNYQELLSEGATTATLRGVQALDATLQRGFVTLESGGRLQLRVDALPSALQATEWQSIPRSLLQDLQTASASFAYRLVEPAFTMTLRLDRHAAAKLLPARVGEITLTSIISDDAVMLTKVRMNMLPGDKRLLNLTLPKDARFWFAFVNQNAVWPWREQDRILIPLDLQSRDGKAVPVEFFYSSRIGTGDGHNLDLELLAPRFDLPLENISWQVYLNEKWHLRHWTGALQLEEQQVAASPVALDVQGYLQNEIAVQRQNTKAAEQMLAFGNSALERGDPQQARRAFQTAFGLSQGDTAFNEDARVQLNNLKLQQALVGLNVRQAAVAGAPDAIASKLKELRTRKDANYTQQDAKAILDRNTAEENGALTRLAQRLIQQQEAAVSSPAAIRATIPEQGRVLTFRRAVLVDPWVDLNVRLQARASTGAAWNIRAVTLVLLFVVLAGFAWSSRLVRREPAMGTL